MIKYLMNEIPTHPDICAMDGDFFNSVGKFYSHRQVNVDRMLLQLTQCEHAFEKSRLQLVMSNCELENYERLARNIETAIQTARGDIEETKVPILLYIQQFLRCIVFLITHLSSDEWHVAFGIGTTVWACYNTNHKCQM